MSGKPHVSSNFSLQFWHHITGEIFMNGFCLGALDRASAYGAGN